MHATALALTLLLAQQATPPAAPTAAEARAFVARVDEELKRLLVRQSTADWVRQTYITDDTEKLSAWANEEVMAYQSRLVPEAARLAQASGLDAETARSLYLIRVGSTLPAPSDPRKRAELATLAARLDSMYGKGKWCGKDGTCRDLEQLSEVMRKSRSWDELLDAWYGWHTIARPMKGDYARLVALGDEGAREIGFRDMGELWRAGYDMTPAELVQETERLWGQVKPLYDDLHCYVRAKLQERYGKDRVPDGKPIPAHLLGNMWAQEWGNVYDLAAPAGAAASVAKLDVGGALQRKGFDAVRMVKLGEGFYTSLGLEPLPASFWQRSMFVKPRDREVVCHASAWDVSFSDDLRVKMCIKPTQDDLVTIHHELGHDYYFQAYWRLPVLFQQGANDGFHEAIGDAIALSVTPAYMKKVGVLDEVPPEDEAGLIAVQLREAMDKIAFLPFGLLVDRWRWEVFSGQIPPSRYEQAWWALRRKYQGVDAPAPRSEADFDPGAKYHVPGNVPYTRYFLARIYQFQFHRALCQVAGQKGPLHACSIYGSKAAGKRLHDMLALGASRPWPEAMYVLTGQRQADASAILDYFAPLQRWLAQQNRGRKCGW
ncbi:MAG TPA: M2 family metallopeptidase [Anaeromyxobacteraceae bacterium]